MKQVIPGTSNRALCSARTLAAELRQAHALQADNTPTLIPAEGRKEV
jgi:hypothetical protein